MRVLLLILFFFTSHILPAQIVFEQDIVQGGVTSAGFSTGLGSGSGSFDIYIEPGSSIKKSYLFFYSLAQPGNVDLFINNIAYNTAYYDYKFQVEHTNNACVPITLYIRDITGDIDPAVTNYTVTIPPPVGGNTICAHYNYVSLFVAYENPSLPPTNYCILLNDKNLIGNESYNVNNLNPVNVINPVGFSIFSDRSSDAIGNKLNVFFNSNFLGLLGKADNINSTWWASGVKGHFYYQDNTLYGLDDDVPNNVMENSDGLANINSFLNQNITSCNFHIINQNWPNQNPSGISIYLAFFLAYTTPCQSFEATANYTCLGNTYQLAATGGIAYEWEPQTDLSCYNCPNPVYTGSKATHYTCRIWSTDSCSKVLPLRIDVPNPDSVEVVPGICGNDDSKINFIKTTSGNFPYAFNIAGQNNSSGEFSGLASGAYTYTVTDTMGCVFSDTVNITESNIVKAGFLTKKFKEDLLKIDFINNSSNATHYMWVLSNGDTLYSENFTQLFDSGGSYQIMLIAYNNYPHCADTVMHTIQVEHALVVLAPNVFTPNGDGLNDSFSINIKGAKEYSVSIFNRWGTEVFNYQKGNDMSWDGHTVSGQEVAEGVYFFTITGILENGESFQKQGDVHLIR